MQPSQAPRPFEMGTDSLICRSLIEAARTRPAMSLAPRVRIRVDTARAEVERLLDKGDPVYGLTAGVGSQKNCALSPAEIEHYSRKLIRGHAIRVPGPTATEDVVRAMLIVQLHELASGYSGASPALVGLIAKLTSGEPMPHIAVITAEPMPGRVASLALGTGDIDCVYHFALYELRKALVDQEREETLDILDTMIEGKRLRDISDLPLDLVT